MSVEVATVNRGCIVTDCIANLIKKVKDDVGFVVIRYIILTWE